MLFRSLTVTGRLIEIPDSKRVLKELVPTDLFSWNTLGGHTMRRMILSLIISVLSASFLLRGEAKTIYIPENIAIEENAIQVTPIRNLSEAEIYHTFSIDVIAGFIFITDYRTPCIIKLSPQGEIMARFGGKGQGPGESPKFHGVSGFKENIAVLGRNKVIICSRDLKYLSEKRLEQFFIGFIVSTDNQVYFYNNPSYENYYFSVYNQDFKFVKKFGIKNPDFKEKKITMQNYKPSMDTIRCVHYVPEENGIWVSFRDRYDLRCYKNERVVVDIKTKKPFFASKDEVFSGEKITAYTDHSDLITKQDNQLYHFYVKNEQLFCDVFDLNGSYRLLRRIKFPYRYRLAHSHESIFYGLRVDKDTGDIYLNKLKILPKAEK